MPRQTTSHSRPEDHPFDALHLLRSEIASLRDAIDELREIIEWGNRNRDGYDPLLFQFRRSGDEPADTRQQQPMAEPYLASDEAPVADRPDDTPRRQETLW